MFIISTIKNSVVNATITTSDTVRGIATITYEAITDNKATKALDDARLLGKMAREEAKAKSLAKKLLKLQKKQDDLRSQADSDF